MLAAFQQLAQVGLLGRVCPADRVVLVRRSCRWLLSETAPHVEDVLLKACARHPCYGEDVACSLQVFRDNRVILIGPQRQPHADFLVRGLCTAAALNGNRGIVHLDLADCQFSNMHQLGAALSGASSLTHLVLSQNRLCSAGVKILARCLRSCSNLKHLDLSRNQLCMEGVVAMLGPQNERASIEYLDVSFNELGPSLPESLSSLSALTHLAVAQNKLGDDGAEKLEAVLQQLTKLTHLNVAYNVIGQEGAAALCRGLRRVTALTHLNIDRVSLGAEGEEWDAALARLTSLTFFSLGGCLLRPENLFPLQLPSLTKLDLRDNMLRAEGVQAFAAISPSSSLTHLDLSANGIGKPDVAPLIAALHSWPRLCHLRLYNNRIDDSGALALAAVLPQLTTLTLLELSSNDLRCYGAKKLVEAAIQPQCSALTKLDLRWNEELMLGTRQELQGRGGKVEMGFWGKIEWSADSL